MFLALVRFIYKTLTFPDHCRYETELEPFEVQHLIQVKLRSKEEKTVVAALFQLHELLNYQNSKSLKMCAAAEKVETARVFTKVLKAWPNNLFIWELTFCCVAEFACQSEKFQLDMTMKKARTLRAIVKGMGTHADCFPVQNHGVWALTNACNRSQVIPAYLVGKLKAHRQIIAAMREFPTNGVFQYDACMALGKLLCHADNKKKQLIRDDGGAAALDAALKHPESASIADEALDMLLF